MWYRETKLSNEKDVINMIIGVDLDNVTAKYTEGLRAAIAKQQDVTDFEAHNLLYGTPVDYYMSNWPNFPDAFYGHHTKAVDDDLYQNLEVMEGASETLWRLSDEGHHLRIITSRFVGHHRHSKVVADTGVWLDKTNIPYRDIMFVASKADIYADIYIDDSPTNVTNLRGVGRDVIVYDQEYNKDFDGLRAYNWDDVYRLIQEKDAAMKAAQ